MRCYSAYSPVQVDLMSLTGNVDQGVHILSDFSMYLLHKESRKSWISVPACWGEEFRRVLCREDLAFNDLEYSYLKQSIIYSFPFPQALVMESTDVQVIVTCHCSRYFAISSCFLKVLEKHFCSSCCCIKRCNTPWHCTELPNKKWQNLSCQEFNKESLLSPIWYLLKIYTFHFKDFMLYKNVQDSAISL